MDGFGTLKSSSHQKAISMKKKQNSSTKSRSKIHPLSDEQNDNNLNSVSKQLNLLNLDRCPPNRNIAGSMNDKSLKKAKLKQNHFKTQSLHGKTRDDNMNSVSEQFSQLNLDRSYLNKVEKNDKPCKKYIDQHKKTGNRSLSRDVLHSGQFYNVADSVNKKFDFKGDRNKTLGSQCSSLRSSISSILSYEDTENDSLLTRNTINDNLLMKATLKQKHLKTNSLYGKQKDADLINKGFGFKGNRPRDLGSQCGSLRSSISSILSYEDTENDSLSTRNTINDNLLINATLKQKHFKTNSLYGKQKNAALINKEFGFKGNRARNLGSQCSSLRSSVSSILSYEETDQKIDHQERNSHRDRRNRKPNNHLTSHLSNHFIKSWILKDDDSLTYSIMKNKEGFKNLFCTHRRINDMIIIFELLNRICKINDPLTKEYLLSFSMDQQFIENMDGYLAFILLSSTQEMLKNLEYLLNFVSNIINVIPSENLNDYYGFLTSSLEKMEKIRNIPDSMLDNIEELITNISEKLNEMNTPLNVSNLNILPSPDDINEIPELQSNIITGPYESPSHYLNIHFKLLKEDFVSNLRSGLQEYESNLKEKKTSRIKDVFVYDAIFCGLMKRTRKTNLTISFEIDNKKLKKVDWKTSKRLIHGSLLLISNDDFKTYYLTLLDDRKTPQSDDKNFVISALVLDKLIKFKEYTKCTIIEPRVFFNPYFQVLKTIKKINTDIFPMEKYIIQTSTEINPPIYMSQETNYLIAGNEVNLNNITSYEYPEIFGLNEFQILALQAALTKEFVIIQGPPGTGKSYLGLKIINILLDNSLVWKKDRSPILVICYRNNAVDQILESLIKDQRKIVRLGNQSNNEHVKNFCLRNAIRQINTKPVLRDKMNVIKDQIEILKSNITEIQFVIQSIDEKKGVLAIDSLGDVLTVTQKQYLSKSNVFEEWLFGGYDECDNNEALLDDLLSNNKEYNSSYNQYKSSYLLLSITGLINELSDLERKIDYLYAYNEHRQSMGQDVLIDVIEILQEYGKKESFLKKAVNRINLDIDNFIDITQLNSDDLFALSIPERWKLYTYWADMFRKQCLEKIEEYLNEINKKQNILEELNDTSDGYKVLQLGPDVVGATTTGAARTRSLLTTIQPKIVIFEEAAEVLECHTVTALTQFCEHVIMIGDHQQLRPNPASHISATKYKLDISLFERMIKNGIEYYTLNEQHRMRPLISSLVIPLFYPELRNHASVEKYPDVRGFRDNMFFVDHIIPEDELVDSESHRNKHEANFILALADYVLKQGYDKEDITILTFYGAQLFYLQAVRSNYPSLKGVSMEVVDNFQGQENKIILLSLVRSNPHSIGFLSKMNRICVALTRAREGFYLIGNMATLKGNSSVWKGINETLQNNNVIGNELPLKCSTHGTITNVQTTDDFKPLVFGGCTLVCGAKLECGHVCELQCHGTDECHLGTYSCQKPCERKAGCGIHDCEALCGVLPCPKCVVIVETQLPCSHSGLKQCEGEFFPCNSNCTDILSCGHPCSKECHFPMPHLPDQYCPMPCGKPNTLCTFGHKCQKMCGEECGECMVETITTLHCGHTVVGKCNQIHNKKCEVLLKKNLECGHTEEVECFRFTSEVECTKSNLKRLSCGHVIEVPCSGGNLEELICKENIEKCLPCGHFITIACHLSSKENLVCEELVEKELKCGHGFQLEKCSTPSDDILCKKKVFKIVEECGHKVKVMCYMKSSKAICKQPCNLKLPCGHTCRGLCGQACPECKEMVEIDQLCGHKGLSPCAVIKDGKTSETNLKISHGSLNCETICKSILKCGHECGGTCGKCMQGRIHEACIAACGSVLLCGHVCSNTCSSGIHLCDKKCLNICKHQICNNKCGLTCQKCKKPCEWQCEHYRCTKLCWEECNRPICEAPCKKLLQCGHTCNGFCGEPCPPVCIRCTPVVDFQPKYILMEDCGHVISKTEFSALISSTIAVFLCPKCQKPQTSSNYLRYYTKNWFVMLPKIRKKLLNKYNNVTGLIIDTRSLLGRMHKLLKLKLYDFEELKLLLNGLIESVKAILLKQNKETCIETLRSLLFVSYYISEAFDLLQQTNKTNDFDHFSRLNYLASYLKMCKTGISRDQMHQYKDELFRLIAICKLEDIQEKKKNNSEPSKKLYLDEAWGSVCRMEEFTNERQNNVVSLIKHIDPNFEINLNLLSSKFISVFEKYCSLTLHKESWKKCNKNGHVFYCPDKALLESDCPTCADRKKDFLF